MWFVLVVCSLLFVLAVGRLTRRPAAPAIEERRGDIARDGFASKKVPEDLDVIVVGSGLSGLCSAALLAGAGKRVLVLEQHYVAGGCTHEFDDKGLDDAYWSSGLHYLGDPARHLPLTNMCMDEPVEWHQLGSEEDGYCFDVLAVGKDRRKDEFFHCRARRWKDDLIKRFPEERKAIEKFHNLCLQSMIAVVPHWVLKLVPLWLDRLLRPCLEPLYMRWLRPTAWETVCDLTENKELRALLLAQFGNIGGSPDQMSFMQMGAIYSHYVDGGFYPIGGSAEYAPRLIRTIERAGGRVLVRAPVDGLIVAKSGRVRGVRVKNVDVRAPIVINAAGVRNLYDNFVPKQFVPDSVRETLDRVGHSCMHMMAFLRLKGTSKELKLPEYNLWVMPAPTDSYSLPEMCARAADTKEGEQDVPPDELPVFICFPSAKDPSFNDRYPGVSTCMIIREANYDWFKDYHKERQGHRSGPYEAKKKRLGETMLAVLRKHFPQITEDRLDYVDFSTPLSTSYFLGQPVGASYGIAPSSYRHSHGDLAFLRAECPHVRGLYNTGQDIYSHGIFPAIVGGYMTAHSVLGLTGTLKAVCQYPEFMVGRVAATYARVAYASVKQ